MFSEIFLTTLLFLVLILLLNPTGFFMPASLHMFLLILLIVFYLLYASFFWRERPQDERESLHRFISARFAYLSGMLVLIGGIVYQSYYHLLDPWLVYVLFVMLFGKILGQIYARKKH